jgi:hypothetical protein
MWLLVGQRVHWVCNEGEIDVSRLRVRAVTGAPRADEDLSVVVGRGLLALERSVDAETVLLLEAGASTMESMLKGLEVACWRLRRLVMAGGSVFLEGRRQHRRRLKTWEMEDGSLELAIAQLVEQIEGDAVLVDPFAFDLRSLRGAEGAGLHSVSIVASAGISRHIASASGFSLKVEIPDWKWIPPFLLDLSQHRRLHRAARKAQVSPARVYQAMSRVKEIRLAVNAVRTGLQR